MEQEMEIYVFVRMNGICFPWKLEKKQFLSVKVGYLQMKKDIVVDKISACAD